MTEVKTNSSITAPRGFLAAGAAGGIKRSGKLDVGAILCPDGATAAAVFTTNKVVSAAVEVCRENLQAGGAKAVIVNSGNANTCTGETGRANARQMCAEFASLCGIAPESVLLASTGIIGEQLPMERVTKGIELVCAGLGSDAEQGNAFARAIMTTDTVEKEAVETVLISGRQVTIAGCVKGAGMIAPNMATTLCFLTTDAVISAGMLQKALRGAIGDSLNKLTVDAHQSTNDTAIILASCKAENEIIDKDGADFACFYKALNALCKKLAKMMARDAEGATRIFQVVVKGAKTKSDAAKAARAVADYDLVKCAVNGGDPNWGRIICAVGSCGVELVVDRLACKLDELTVFKDGRPAKFDRALAEKIVSSPEHRITVELGAGDCEDFCYGCDLSKGYVEINADYHT
ncbi:MAG: bifunctional glutamate N-acetyltransferase/amino-acid acetyltransferase ArgJ [Phycisphaerae bacterium]